MLDYELTHNVHPINVIYSLQIKPSQVPVASGNGEGDDVLLRLFADSVLQLG